MTPPPRLSLLLHFSAYSALYITPSINQDDWCWLPWVLVSYSTSYVSASMLNASIRCSDVLIPHECRSGHTSQNSNPWRSSPRGWGTWPSFLCRRSWVSWLSEGCEAHGTGAWAAEHDGPMTLVWEEEKAGPTGMGRHSGAVAKRDKGGFNRWIWLRNVWLKKKKEKKKGETLFMVMWKNNDIHWHQNLFWHLNHP